MPLALPDLDNRRYADLRDEALARIPVHNPEWTNFNESDPGVTLVELFAFLTETLLYRANQIPERNRRKFLQLLGIGLRPASAARGIVVFTNERGPAEPILIPAGTELRAGAVPFRTAQGLEVLPVEALAFVKRPLATPTPELRAYYNQLYEAILEPPLEDEAVFYETVPFAEAARGTGVDLSPGGTGTADGWVWLALLRRTVDAALSLDEVRRKLAGRTLTLGLVPALSGETRRLAPKGPAAGERDPPLVVELPTGGALPASRQPAYARRTLRAEVDVLAEPGTVQVLLPGAEGLALWEGMEPLEAGTGDFPPALEDTNLEARLVTWLRIRPRAGANARLLWLGAGATTVEQRARIRGELLPPGNGRPEQEARLARRPVIQHSVRLSVTTGPAAQPATETWEEVADLAAAGPELPMPDPLLPPGTPPPPPRPAKVFALDPEAGLLRFGDGFRGARLPNGAVVRAEYDAGDGKAGNLGPGAINAGPELPPGIRVTNPIRSWGGADAETVEAGEKSITRHLQHRDRAVTAEDFAAIAREAPGVEIGRVEVVPAYSPELAASEPGDAAGSVTLMLIPRSDPEQPDAPRPDRLFLDAVCRWMDERRLVTTELFLRGPEYRPVWVAVGIEVAPGQGVAEVQAAVEAALRRFLAPLPARPGGLPELVPAPGSSAVPSPPDPAAQGWPLRKPVVALELQTAVSRVPGVLQVNGLELQGGDSLAAVPALPMSGLQLPRLLGLSVSLGPPAPVAELRGRAVPAGDPGGGRRRVPVPVLPKTC